MSQVLRCCISSENPVWPLVYQNYTLVTWKFICIGKWTQKVCLRCQGERHHLPPQSPKGSKGLSAPPYLVPPSLLTVETALSKSLLWSPWWSQAVNRWKTAMQSEGFGKDGYHGHGVFKTVVNGVAPTLTPQCWWDYCLCLWNSGGGKWGKHGRKKLGEEKETISKKYKILVLIKGWDIYISHSLDNSHFVRSFFTYSGTERAVSESQVSLHKATWI